MNLAIRVATLEDVPTLIQLHSEMDGALPLPIEQAQRIFTEMSKVPDYHEQLTIL